jgi:hypothetical protein
VRPVVLDHVDPHREQARSDPQQRRERRASHQPPQQREVARLRDREKHRVRGEAHRPRLQDGVRRDVDVRLVREIAQVQRLPEPVGGELVRVAGMIGVLVVQAVAIHPGDGIDVDAEGVVHEREALDEPFLVVERAMRDPHVNHAGEVQAGEEPADDEVCHADPQPRPGAEMGRREIRRSRRIAQQTCITDRVVDLHELPPESRPKKFHVA